jgi:hypothetical protein
MNDLTRHSSAKLDENIGSGIIESGISVNECNLVLYLVMPPTQGKAKANEIGPKSFHHGIVNGKPRGY